MQKGKLKKILLRSGIFTLVAAGALVGAYALTPARKKSIDTDSYNDGPYETTYFNRFVSKITESFEKEDEVFGLSANLKNLEITWPTKDETSMNQVSINGALNLVMRNITDFDVTIDINADYNGRGLNFALGYVNSDIYLALQDLRIKSSHTSTIDFLNYVNQQFFDPTNPDGLGIDINIEQFIDETLGGFDITSLLGEIQLPTTKETVNGDEVTVDLEMDDIALSIILDKENLFIKKVDLGTLKFGDVTITGALECNTISEVVPFDDPDYPNPKGEFHEVISYIGWVDRLLDLFKTRKFGFELNAQLSLDDEEGTSKLVDLNASIDVDASDVLDFTNIVLGKDEENVGRPEDSDYVARGESSPIYNPNGKLQFNAHFSLKGQSDEEYANIDISYFDNAGYLTLNENAFNEAVMRAKMDNDTLTALINKIPELLASFTPTIKSTKALRATAADTTDDLLSFITSSDLINGINNGDYSPIIDMIKEISNDEKGINLALNLAPLGLGSNAEIDLSLDSTKGIEKAVSLEVSNIEVGPLAMSAQGDSKEFSDTNIAKVIVNKDSYDDMAFTNSVIEQASDILSIKKGQIKLDGSLFDNNNQGVKISGIAQFDANEQLGYGSLKIRQYSDDIVNSNKYLDHNIDFDINDKGTDVKERNVHLVYNTNLKAKITTTTFTDIFDLITDLMNSDDERFTKFDETIQEMLLGTALADVISSKDYLELAKSTYLKSIKQINSGNSIQIVISGSALGMNSDITVQLNFKDDNGSKKISSLSLANLMVEEKTLNLTISLEDYNDSYTSPVNLNDNFMDFSQIKVLLDFGINTTKLNYYHLSASANLQISGLKLITFDLDFHIHVDGKKTRVYGVIPDVQWMTDLMSADIATTSITSEFVFEPTEDIGGIFHIVRNEDHALWGKDEVNYYQADSSSFLDNIVTYLVVDMLNIKSSAISNLSDMTISSEKSYDPDFSKLFTDTGFQYSHNNTTGINTWKVGINLNQILCNDSLGAVELTLNGKDETKSGLFTTASVSMAIASLVKINVDLTLENPNFETETWPQEIENKYNKVLSWYSNLSASDKTRYDSQFKNQPLKTWRSVEKANYF